MTNKISGTPAKYIGGKLRPPIGRKSKKISEHSFHKFCVSNLPILLVNHKMSVCHLLQGLCILQALHSCGNVMLEEGIKVKYHLLIFAKKKYHLLIVDTNINVYLSKIWLLLT